MFVRNCLLTVVSVLLLAFQAEAEFSAPECQAWRNISDNIRNLEPLNMTCSVHPSCTGFQCAGVLNVNGKQETMGFSVSLIPCTDPIKLEIAIDSSTHTFNTSLSVEKNKQINETIPLPALSQALSPLKAEAYLTVVLASFTSVDGNQLISIEMYVTVGIPVRRTSFVLIPKTTIPYRSCFGHPTAALSPASSPMMVKQEELTDENCTHLSMSKPCTKLHQVCILINGSKDAKCACVSGFYWHPDLKECTDTMYKRYTPESAGTISTVWIVAIVVIVGIVILAGILAVVYRKYRRNQRYGQHQLLAQDDDTSLIDG